MVETFQGSVNRWECDENDHQNVRFYLHKLHQGLVIGLQRHCLLEHAAAAQALQHLRYHHIRFLQEARVAIPQIIECGVLHLEPARELKMLSVMRNAATKEVLATFISAFDLSDLAVTPFTGKRVPVPESASPRGIAAQSSSYAHLDYQQAVDVGFLQVGAGVILAEECCAEGRLEPYRYMGRISDGMPNLWALLQSPADIQARSEGLVGGAVLEYRLEFHKPLRQGCAYVHLAGVHAVANKTQSMSHLVYDVASGELCASSEALGVTMDLTTRKSIPIPEAQRRRIEELKLQPAPR